MDYKRLILAATLPLWILPYLLSCVLWGAAGEIMEFHAERKEDQRQYGKR